MVKPTKLYHVTTRKKAKLYQCSGYIAKPVRGFTTLTAAMAWAIKVGRQVIYEIDLSDYQEFVHKLPDHHNQWGEAWWIDKNVLYEELNCVYSPEKA